MAKNDNKRFTKKERFVIIRIKMSGYKERPTDVGISLTSDLFSLCSTTHNNN
jgi:hypothetical protein